MKRIFTHLMRAFAAMALAMVALSAGARAATRNFGLPHYLANPGGTVEVPLTLNNASGLAAIRVQINFDPEVLELQSVSAGPLGEAFELSHGKGEGFVQLLLVRAGSLAGGSGRLAVLKFRANPGAKAKVYSDLAIADIGLSDSSGVINLRQKDSLRLTNGKVAITLSPDIHNGGSSPSEWWTDLHALSGLTLSTGKLNTGFSPSVLTYSTSVTFSSIKVAPILADPNAKVKVNGVPVKAGSSSGAIPLAIGTNKIMIRVTSQNGTSVKTYTIKVTRVKSSDAALSGLVVKAATLGPKFKPTITGYAASVPFSTESVRIAATASHGAARIKIEGTSVKSGTLSGAIPLKIGENEIKVVLIAESGSTKTYKITISRAKSLAAPFAPHSLAAAMIWPPRESMVSGRPVVSKMVQDGQKYLQLTIRRNLGTPKPVIEVSPNLMDWFSGDRHTTTLMDDEEILKVRDNTPITPGVKRFIRTQDVAE